mgnify:CR=1 FL=1
MTREEAIEILKAHHMWTGEPQEIIEVRKENMAIEMAIEALKEISDLNEVYRKGYKDGQEMVSFHLELCKEEQTSILEEIKDIINIPNNIIQEDVLKYKMICEVLKNEGYN